MSEHAGGAKLRAFRLNENDWYAASSMDEAIEVAMAHTGLARDEVLDEVYAYEDNSTPVFNDEGERRTTGEIAALEEKPGFLCGTE
jgi:hypothetical protein